LTDVELRTLQTLIETIPRLADAERPDDDAQAAAISMARMFADCRKLTPDQASALAMSAGRMLGADPETGTTAVSARKHDRSFIKELGVNAKHNFGTFFATRRGWKNQAAVPVVGSVIALGVASSLTLAGASQRTSKDSTNIGKALKLLARSLYHTTSPVNRALREQVLSALDATPQGDAHRIPVYETLMNRVAEKDKRDVHACMAMKHPDIVLGKPSKREPVASGLR
jgi:hypothetical protein